MVGARAALAAGLVVVGIAVAIVMAQSPDTLSRTNAPHALNVKLASVPGGGRVCQGGELVPAGTSTIGVSLNSSAGPSVTATVLAGGAVVTHGHNASGWLGRLVTIPVAPLDHAVHDATVCFAFTGADERVSFLGVPGTARSGASSSAGTLHGRLSIEYLRHGTSSWWSQIQPVARRLGLGRAWAGTWVAVLVALLMACAIAVATWTAARRSV